MHRMLYRFNLCIFIYLCFLLVKGKGYLVSLYPHRQNSGKKLKSNLNLPSNSKLQAKASSSIIYVCSSCGNEHIKWVGKCTCGEWNTVKEFRVPIASKLDSLSSSILKSKTSSSNKIKSDRNKIISLSDIRVLPEIDRIKLWSNEVNTVLGGGLVQGSVVLIAGEPGVGKSTLLLQISSSVSDIAPNSVIYVSGEENSHQILSRFNRLGLNSNNIFLYCGTDADAALSNIISLKSVPSLLIVDSIQMMHTISGGNQGNAGSVPQIRDSTSLFVEYAKSSGCVVILVGHVTKSGDVAGPKVLEHMVDTVLYMESSEGAANCRLIRCMKNRFGATDEVGVLAMTVAGLTDVSNPSEMFMSKSVVSVGVEGCAVAVTMEGSRPLMTEIQCLVGPHRPYIPGASTPKASKRTTDGFSIQRLLLICAVIEKHIGLNLGQRDIFLNVVGGMRINEPAADLAVAVTIVSSLLEIKVKPAFGFIGEVGLGGELRGGGLRIDLRVQEALKLGLTQIIVPEGSYENFGHFSASIIPCPSLEAALEIAMISPFTREGKFTKKAASKRKPSPMKVLNIEDNEMKNDLFHEYLFDIEDDETNL